MGDIFRKVDICGLTEEGKQLGCTAANALIDPGATKTVISRALAKKLGGSLISGYKATVEGRDVPLKLAGVTLRAPGCDIDALTVAVDDTLVARAGHPAEMILGHDYLQHKRAAARYGNREDDHEIVCRSARLRSKRTKTSLQGKRR